MSDETHEERRKLAKLLVEAEDNYAHHYRLVRDSEQFLAGAERNLAGKKEHFEKAKWCLEQAKAAMLAALTPAPYGATRLEVAAFKARYFGFQPYEGAALQDAPDQSETTESEPVEFISDLTGNPAIEPESGLHGDPVLRAFEDDQIIAPAWIDEQTCEPISPHVKPEGYAPVVAADNDARHDDMWVASGEAVTTVNEDGSLTITNMGDSDVYVQLASAAQAEPEQPTEANRNRFDPFAVFYKREKEDA